VAKKVGQISFYPPPPVGLYVFSNAENCVCCLIQHNIKNVSVDVSHAFTSTFIYNCKALDPFKLITFIRGTELFLLHAYINLFISIYINHKF
jgi:hypothetical protein